MDVKGADAIPQEKLPAAKPLTVTMTILAFRRKNVYRLVICFSLCAKAIILGYAVRENRIASVMIPVLMIMFVSKTLQSK